MMFSKKETFCSPQDTSSSTNQDMDDCEILRHEQDQDESFTIELSPVIEKKTTSSLTADETTPEYGNGSPVCPKSPSKKTEVLQLHPIKSRKKLLLDILVPLNVISEKEQKDNQKMLKEESNLPRLLKGDVITLNKSCVKDYESGMSEEHTLVQNPMHETVSRPPLRELVLQTPDMGKLALFQSSTISASTKSDITTSSEVTSPVLLGSAISGISTLNYTSSDVKSEGSQPKSAAQVSASMHESSSQDFILTSTPRNTTRVFDWEEISNVTDGLSDCSSLRPFRKNSKFTYSSDLPFSDFSQESCASNGSNGEKDVNSSQELSGSDKENIEPNSNKFEMMKRINRSPSFPGLKSKSFCNEKRQISSQPLVSKRRRHRSFEDTFVHHSLSQPNSTVCREIFLPEKRIKVDPGLDCEENDFPIS